jgi:beta-galactosidase/beta-glucuronidase
LRKLLLTSLLALVLPAAGAKAPPLQSVLYEGPGGCMPLTEWTMTRDPFNHGLRRAYEKGAFGGTTVSLPNVVNPLPYSGPAGSRNYRGSIAWYRTTFQASSAGLYQLAFQSANYEATVFVDGQRLGAHRGSYLPFAFDQQLSAGAHAVVVRVDWRNPGRQSKEGFHRTWFNWGGLNGEVDVRALGASDLEHPSIQTTLTSGEAKVQVSVEVHNFAATRSIAPQGTLMREGASVPISFPVTEVPAGTTKTVTGTVTVTNPALWSPSSPNRYQLELSVPGESSYSALVGLRQLSWHGGELFLNGQQLRMHGVSIQEDRIGHGDALTPADEDELVEELGAVHANVVRAQHPLDPALLERLDAAGILVWQGVGPVEGAGQWYATTPKLRKAAEAQARTAVLAARLHPSIFAWNLVDEIAGNGRDQAEVDYVVNTGRWLHATDPGRMVAVDVWGDHPATHPGAIYSEADAVAETDYTGWYDSPHDSQSQLAAQMRARLRAMAKAFPAKVLVISEFGAESNDLNPEGKPGSYAFQSRLLALHIKVYAEDPRLTAMMIWLLRDYPLTPTFEGGSIRQVIHPLKLLEGLNQKGLFTYTGAAKPAVGAVARLYAALPTG